VVHLAENGTGRHAITDALLGIVINRIAFEIAEVVVLQARFIAVISSLCESDIFLPSNACL